jgi:transposase
MANGDQQKQLELILSKAEAEEIYSLGPEAVVFKLLELSRRIKELESQLSPALSSTPSGQIPVYQKPTSPSSRKKPGRKKGHEGSRRRTPPRIDRQEKHSLERCPECGGTVGKVTRRRKRIIEDVKTVEPETVEHEIEGHWCSACKKIVEPVVPDALPKSTIGHRAVALTSWLHYGLGITLSQIREVFNYHLQFSLTPGGLVQMWYRIQAILYTWYEQIGQEAKDSAYPHGDESGWRVNGKTHWLWCFTNDKLTYYMIEKCRGSPAIIKFLGEEFGGCLITDFWEAYNKIRSESRQYCLAHLLREIHDVDERNESDEWRAFSKKLKRLLGDSFRLHSRRGELSEKEYQSKNRRFDGRLESLIFECESEDSDVNRLSKRLVKSLDGLFTFLDNTDVDPTNNRAEREIRPAVIIRKNSLGNRSEKGANCQAVLMSIYRTLKLRGLNPIDTVVKSLREYVKSGVLPPLPTSDG